MPRFDKSKIKELKEVLYYSNIHDAKIESVRYECGEDKLKIEAFNTIFNVKIDLTFFDIEIALAIRGHNFGSRETIISLTAEEDFTHLRNNIPKYSEGIEDSLYLLFEMLSGDELHIVSKEVIVEISR